MNILKINVGNRTVLCFYVYIGSIYHILTHKNRFLFIYHTYIEQINT